MQQLYAIYLTSDKPHYPFELPKGWEWCRLEDIAYDLMYGTSEKSSRLGKIPVLRMGNINREGGLDWKDLVYSNNEEDIEKFNLLHNDLLFNRTNSSEWVGKTAIYKGERPAIYAGYIIRLRTIFVNADYINFVMNSQYHRNWCNDVKTDAVNQSNINAQKLSVFRVPLPPIEEQKRIVKEIKRWLSLIKVIKSGKENLQESIKQTKSKVLDLAIHGKLVPQDPNEEPAIELLKRINPKAEIITDNGHYQKLPVGWCMTNIESLFEAVSAKRVLKSEWKNKGIPFYRAREIVQLSKEGIADKDLFVSKEHYSELKEKYGVPSCDDIMISAVGSIGYTYIVKKGDVFYYKDASVLCLKNTNHWNPTFFKIWLASPFLQEQMYKNSKGTTVNTITLEKLKGYVIPLPPITEQHRIVSKVEDLFSQLDNIASSL